MGIVADGFVLGIRNQLRRCRQWNIGIYSETPNRIIPQQAAAGCHARDRDDACGPCFVEHHMILTIVR